MLTRTGPASVEVQQIYRGTATEQVTIRGASPSMAVNMALEEVYELEKVGDPAGEIYENLQVLGHLPEEQFTRLMAAITESPKAARTATSPSSPRMTSTKSSPGG